MQETLFCESKYGIASTGSTDSIVDIVQKRVDLGILHMVRRVKKESNSKSKQPTNQQSLGLDLFDLGYLPAFAMAIFVDFDLYAVLGDSPLAPNENE